MSLPMGNESNERIANARKWSDWPPSPPMAVSALFVVACAVGAATWAIATSVTSERVTNLENKVTELTQSTQPIAAPAATRAASDEPAAVAELSARIEALEEEKKGLVTQLATLSRDALDPKSEVGTLVQQLESDAKAERLAAAVGLFTIRDTRALPPLIDYYQRDPGEATTNRNVKDYIRFAMAADRNIGADFVMQVLDGPLPLHAQFAYEWLQASVIDTFTDDEHAIEFDTTFASRLENAALRSDDALVRTRAKVLLRDRREIEENKRKRDEESHD